LKEKIGKFMERKEHNAEGKTSACQITSSHKYGPKNVYLGFY
jgi:uncharacterized protein YjbJ (UPF0337 family)